MEGALTNSCTVQKFGSLTLRETCVSKETEGTIEHTNSRDEISPQEHAYCRGVESNQNETPVNIDCVNSDCHRHDYLSSNHDRVDHKVECSGVTCTRDHNELDDKIGCICEDGVLSYASQNLTSIPDSLASHHATVKELYLDYNDIEELPESIAQCRQLAKLSAVGNQFSELPQSIGSLLSLQELFLNENELKALPESIIRLKRLHTLNIVGNQIKVLPENFGDLTSLHSFYADENLFCILPESFGLLRNLQTAELSNNKLTKLPNSFGQLDKLRILNLSYNKIATLPNSFSELVELREVDLSSNTLELLPCNLACAKVLQKLIADNNNLRNVPVQIGEMPELLELSLKDNHLEGTPLPDSFGHTSTKLRVLEIGGNYISSLPDSLGELKNLELVHIGSVIDELERRNFQNGNWLWNLPKNFGELISLREAHLDENQLGMLPDNFGDLVHLEFLDLGQNQLHELPDSFGQLRSLKTCQLSKNHIEILPSNFGDLHSLIDFRMDNNQLAELPESFCKLTQLKTLDLFNNSLKELPGALRYLTNLTRLDLDENDFGIAYTEVPHILTRAKYEPRDPKKKGGWRGHVREDLLEVEITCVEEGDKECEEQEDESLEVQQYNERALENAMRQSLSIWKTHGGPEKRELYQPRTSKKVAFENPKDQYYDDEEEEEDSDSYHGSSAENSHSDTPTFNGPSFTWNGEEEVEDWEKEINIDTSGNPYADPPVYQHPHAYTNRAFRSTSPTNVFVPGDKHVLPVARPPTKFEVEEGQFDDVDDCRVGQPTGDDNDRILSQSMMTDQAAN